MARVSKITGSIDLTINTGKFESIRVSSGAEVILDEGDSRAEARQLLSKAIMLQLQQFTDIESVNYLNDLKTAVKGA
jgi:hypothetical protein